MRVPMKTDAPRRAWRLLDQQRQEGALGLPQYEAPGQPQPQPGLPSLPELDGAYGVDAPCAMDQTARPAGRGSRRAGEPQGPRGAGRRGRGCVPPKAPRVADFQRLAPWA